MVLVFQLTDLILQSAILQLSLTSPSVAAGSCFQQKSSYKPTVHYLHNSKTADRQS